MKRLLLLVCVSLLAGCGFHLREGIRLPADMGEVRVVSPDPYSPLALGLTEALKRQGVQAVQGGRASVDEAPTTTLSIRSEAWADKPIAQDQFGRAREYALHHAVVFELRNADDTLRVPAQAIELTRDYVASPTDAIGRNGEREILVREMQRDMLAAVMRRLNSALNAQAPAASSTSDH